MTDSAPGSSAIELERIRMHAREMLRAGRMKAAFLDLAAIVEAHPPTRERTYLSHYAFKKEKRGDHIALMFAAAMLEIGDAETATMLFQIARPSLAADQQLIVTKPCADLAQYCATRGHPVFFKPEYDLGLMMRPKPEAFFRSYVANLPNGRVIGHSWLPVSEDGQIFIDQVAYNAPRAFGYAECDRTDAVAVPAHAHYMLRASRTNSYGAAVLVGQGSNFGHWLLNNAGRLALIEGHKELEALPLIIGTEPFRARAALETLRLIGVDHERLIQIQPGELAAFEQLWVPSQLFCQMDFQGAYWSPNVLHFLRRRLGVGDPKPGRRRLYLSRQSARYRRLCNEPEVFRLLQPLGFERLDVGEFSLAEQIEVAADAAAIVGPTGNAMNLALFAPRGVPVVELGYREMRMRVLSGFCRALSQPFIGLDGPMVPGADKLTEADFTIDPEIVRLSVQSSIDAT